VMIEGYFDESGIHEGAPVCIVGGYYGTQAAWRKFETQWNAILFDYPELSSKGFHAKVFFARDKGNRVQEYGSGSQARDSAKQMGVPRPKAAQRKLIMSHSSFAF
jgi:hypothetical protein